MSNKESRELSEMRNLFSNPKTARQAWKSIGQAIALQPALKPIPYIDKDGNETFNSMIERYSYENLSKDLQTLAKSQREPTELEMIMHCQMIKARTDTSAAIFVRDTLGAKPVDETKMDASVHNPYESLTDEELELIANARKQKELEKVEPNELEASPHIVEQLDNQSVHIVEAKE